MLQAPPQHYTLQRFHRYGSTIIKQAAIITKEILETMLEAKRVDKIFIGISQKHHQNFQFKVAVWFSAIQLLSAVQQHENIP